MSSSLARTRSVRYLRFRVPCCKLAERRWRKPLDGSVKVIESLILNKKGNLSVHAAKRFVFFDQQHSVCFADKAKVVSVSGGLMERGSRRPRRKPCVSSGFGLPEVLNGFPMPMIENPFLLEQVGFSEGNEIFIFRNFSLGL